MVGACWRTVTFEDFYLSGGLHANVWPWPHLPQLGLAERERIHEGLSDDRQAAVQVWSLLQVKHELRVLYDVDPEAEG